MLRTIAIAVVAVLAVGCKKKSDSAAVAEGSAAPGTGAPVAPAPGGRTLPSMRRALQTTIKRDVDPQPVPTPPADLFSVVRYKAPLGENVAYVTPERPGERRPAIVWMVGGFDWGVSSTAWDPAPRDNDQSARAFREAGIVLMLPALRGSNGNPGQNECFLGEVDDILSAVEYLATRADVDPARIYVGGHSTGAVLALLAAESTGRLRATFAFGPVADPSQYGASGCLPEGTGDGERIPRAPISFLREITTPTFVIEGADGNAGVFPMMQAEVGGAPVQFLVIPGANHFNVLAPGTEVVARAILADTGPSPKLDVTVDAIAKQLAAK